METLATVFRQAGLPIYINLCVSIIVIAIIIDRIVALFFMYRINTDIFMRAIINLVKNGELEKAVKVCDSTKALVAKICRAGLLKANKTTIEISSAIDEELMRVMPLLERRIASLWSLANIATLIGLIGTIFGLIRAFSGLAAISQEKKAEFLARGISEALNNTALGLTIAVMCMIGHVILSSTSKKMLADLELSSVSLENFLMLRQRGEGK